MSLLFPLIASVLQAAAFTLDKVTLSIKKVNYKTYNGISFPLIFLFTLIAFLIFKPALNFDLLSGHYLALMIALLIIVALGNLIFYRALKSDQLSEIQTISLVKQIPLILFASIFFIDERNFFLITLALLAALSVIWSHWEKHHFHIAKKTLPFLIWNLIMTPIGAIILKILLESWHPISLQLVIDGVIAIVFIALFFKNIKSVPRKALPLLFTLNLLTSIASILYLFSFQALGIVQTVLIFSIQPLLVYFSSVFFLKEKFDKKKFTAFAIILVAIVVSQIYS